MVYNNVLRDEEYIHRLKDAIFRQYGITAIGIKPAKRGYYGETWKVTGTAGRYFLKLDYLPFHQKKISEQSVRNRIPL